MNDANPQPSDTPIPSKPAIDIPITSTTGNGDNSYRGLSLTYFSPPRLSVIHILAFIILAAGLILFQAYLEKLNPRPDHSGIMILWNGLRVIRNLIVAASLVGLCILLHGKICGIPRQFQPGHWILMFESIGIILALFIWGSVYLTKKPSSQDNMLFIVLMGYDESLLMLAYALLLCFLHETASWKALFAVFVVLHAALGLMFFSQGMLSSLRVSTTEIMMSMEIGAFLILIVTAALDRKNYPIRDWLHWLGLALLGYGLVFSIISRGIQLMQHGFS